MAKLVFGMNVSLDGYVDHDKFAPGPVLFRHFIDQTREAAGSLYGRKLYEIMAYWDVDQADWTDDLREFAEAWRKHPKWVVSNTLTSVGPNATLVKGDLASAVRELKASVNGVIEAGGPALAQTLTDLGLIDEYHVYLHPVVLGEGNRFFHAARPRLKLQSNEQIGDDVLRLCYVPA